jgi:threonine/homoserine/homoserine lactone efflux protein
VHPNLWAFAAVAAPLVLSPGASTALVLRKSIAGGTRAGVETAVGINAGSAFYGLLTAFGVTVLVQRWPTAWTALRIAGTAYLAWLGFEALRRAFTADERPLTTTTAGDKQPLARNLVEGFFTNLLNPSIAAFYLLIVPQFIPRGADIASSVMMLTAVHVAMAVTCHMTWAAAGGALAVTLGRSGPRRFLEGVMGVALLGLAAKVALG